jgi:hypothetical protein
MIHINICLFCIMVCILVGKLNSKYKRFKIAIVCVNIHPVSHIVILQMFCRIHVTSVFHVNIM